MKLWIERGYSRLPIAERMLAANPSLDLYTSPSQTPDGATPLVTPSLAAGATPADIARIVLQKGIDAFWPQHAARTSLDSLPCVVHAAATPDVISLVDDKHRFMDWLGDDPYRPDQVEVHGAGEVMLEYERRTRQGRTTCVKPAVGVNGRGYWKIVPGGASFLDDPEPREISPEAWIAAAVSAGGDMERRRMLVMDWLPGPEVSVDLLCWRGRPLIHAARTKIDANHQRIDDEHDVIEHTRRIAERLGLHGIVSAQYRLDRDGRWRMLEVNPRPAGGSIHSEDAGFGIITAWTGLVTREIEPDDCLQHRASTTIRFERSAMIVMGKSG